MSITEILITGYDGENGIFATSVTPDRARIIRVTDAADGWSAVDSISEVASTAFDSLLEVLAEMGVNARTTVAAASR